jgi:plasmid stabilization system protein ParE
MPHVEWSASALNDLLRLYDFLAEDSESAARRAIATIREQVGIVAAFPGIGRPVPWLSPDYRERIVVFGQSAYIILYRNEDNRTFIVAIRHGREAGY